MSNYTLPFPDKKLERCQIQQYFNYIVSVSFIGRGNHRPAVLCDIYMLHCFLINWIKSATDMLLICFNKYMTYMRKKKKKIEMTHRDLKKDIILKRFYMCFYHMDLTKKNLCVDGFWSCCVLSLTVSLTSFSTRFTYFFVRPSSRVCLLNRYIFFQVCISNH
jgi:hypothetical protein